MIENIVDPSDIREELARIKRALPHDSPVVIRLAEPDDRVDIRPEFLDDCVEYVQEFSQRFDTSLESYQAGEDAPKDVLNTGPTGAPNDDTSSSENDDTYSSEEEYEDYKGKINLEDYPDDDADFGLEKLN
ncbi:hypothetical protein GGU11DRAFT_748911 [Lentinula aff. detonsa]|nr:hypothetical protein GGU11DRAFT_748911 [Lentinula aff. detonsa]